MNLNNILDMGGGPAVVRAPAVAQAPAVAADSGKVGKLSSAAIDCVFCSALYFHFKFQIHTPLIPLFLSLLYLLFFQYLI